jgi:hypothetical protein
MSICTCLTLSNSAIAHIQKPHHIALPDTQSTYRICRACSATNVCTAVAFVANPLLSALTSNTKAEIFHPHGRKQDFSLRRHSTRSLIPALVIPRSTPDDLAVRQTEWEAEGGESCIRFIEEGTRKEGGADLGFTHEWDYHVD